MSNLNQEIVYEGWLTKSPPTKRIFKARWRRRWFVLKASGELPMQYFLMYYTGKDCRKMKGTIDLDQCDQVDAGLRFENSKQNYPHMFDIRTPKRTYYLAADSESEMNKWVDCVCQVCALKASVDDSIVFEEENGDHTSSDVPSVRRSMQRLPEKPSVDYYNDPQTRLQPFPDSPPVSPTSSISGPYIHVSECVSGKPLNTPKGIMDFNIIISRQEMNSKLTAKDQSAQSLYSFKSNIPHIQQKIVADDISKESEAKHVALPMPVPLPKPPVVERTNSLYEERNSWNPGRENKITNIESAKKMAMQQKDAVSSEFYDCPRKVVADDEWQTPVPPAAPAVPAPNWETFPCQTESDFSPGDIGSWSVVERQGKLTIVDSKAPFLTNSLNRQQNHRPRQPQTHSLGRHVAPPRPPKPQHLVIAEQPHEEAPARATDSEPSPSPSSTTVMDETYDIPRSHQPHDLDARPRNAYCNANPRELHKGHQGNVFRYDFTDCDAAHPSSSGETISPRFEGPANQYSNLPSPLLTPAPGVPTPPAVNRELKPARKMSDSGASSEPSASPGPLTPSLAHMPTSSAEPSPSAGGHGPPSIDRTLKPRKPLEEGAIKLARPPDGNLSLRRVRAGPSPTPPTALAIPIVPASGSTRSPHHERLSEIYQSFPAPGVQYLDLDMGADGCSQPGPLGPPPTAAVTSATAYKTIDFLKTVAFNRTREEIEEKRKVASVE